MSERDGNSESTEALQPAAGPAPRGGPMLRDARSDDAGPAPFRPRDDAAEVGQFVAEIKTIADSFHAMGLDRGEAKLLWRAFQELRDSFAALAPYRARHKVTVFGSARTPATSPLYGHAIAFGAAIAKAGYMVITGAGPGIMEAAHKGAGRAMSIGLNIQLPFEQSANAVIEGDPKLLTFNYFFTRKLLFLKEADALVLFPGGFGTFDEAFEVLTMLQTGKAGTIPVVMLDVPGGDFWHRWLEYVRNSVLSLGMISAEDFNLFRLTDSVEAAVEEIAQFYRVYHSQRYVGKRLALRLKKPLSEAILSAINEEFRDILVEGSFRQGEAHPHEANETAVADLPRLFFRFNRRAHGRLRQLIDRINQT